MLLAAARTLATNDWKPEALESASTPKRWARCSNSCRSPRRFTSSSTPMSLNPVRFPSGLPRLVNEADFDRIRSGKEDDRNGHCRSLGSECRSPIERRNDRDAVAASGPPPLSRAGSGPSPPFRPGETAITALGREPGGGVVVVGDAFTGAHRAPIISAAAGNNVPAVYPQSDYVRDRGLLSYGADQLVHRF